MLLKTCNRCGNLIPYGKTYCSICAPIVSAEREARKDEARARANRKYNNKRDPKYIRFYHSTEWRTLASKYAQDLVYKCEVCGSIASEVHHKQAIQTPEGWEQRLDYDNLELLCVKCHNDRHNRFKKKKSKVTLFGDDI